MKNQLSKTATYGFNYLRSIHYTVQAALLPIIDRAVNGKTERSMRKFGDHLKMAFPKVQKLFERDQQNVAAGFYPNILKADEVFSLFLSDYKRLPLLLVDAVRAHRQRDSKSHADFSPEAEEFLEKTPEYYRRNFHFQSDGYLSESSAELYDHQVEVLFSGTAQTMRRQIIAPMKAHFNHSDGKGLKILEIASGTGSLTKWLALAFPQAKIVCVDLSPHYIKKAQQNLKAFKNVSFIQGLAEDLEFKDASFDAVVSCYLFHELPFEVRKKVILEKWRVLKKSGFFGIVDSIQKGDDDDLQWALDQFPVDFHEPFYKNYIQNNLKDLMEKCVSLTPTSEIHFLSKLVYLEKKVN